MKHQILLLSLCLKGFILKLSSFKTEAKSEAVILLSDRGE